jgi:hypothetical protein
LNWANDRNFSPARRSKLASSLRQTWDWLNRAVWSQQRPVRFGVLIVILVVGLAGIG